jgi:3-isopropylmalate/(R)-2-methylmalate dehydratase small subunit
MKPLTTVVSRALPLPVNDIDTDQIIPARFLTVTTREGLGRHLFADLRYRSDGSEREDFPLNRKEHAGARILLAGDNFGCGSSREHAAWALADFGIRAIVSSAFADIFRGNALKNGILPVQVEPAVLAALQKGVEVDPTQEYAIDLEARELRWAGGTVAFPLDRFAQQCLLHGVDELGYILRFAEAITSFELQREGAILR